VVANRHFNEPTLAVLLTTLQSDAAVTVLA
jgi:hypothetical protein